MTLLKQERKLSVSSINFFKIISNNMKNTFYQEFFSFVLILINWRKRFHRLDNAMDGKIPVTKKTGTPPVFLLIKNIFELPLDLNKQLFVFCKLRKLAKSRKPAHFGNGWQKIVSRQNIQDLLYYFWTNIITCPMVVATSWGKRVNIRDSAKNASYPV